MFKKPIVCPMLSPMLCKIFAMGNDLDLDPPSLADERWWWRRCDVPISVTLTFQYHVTSAVTWAFDTKGSLLYLQPFLR